jgi:hypothetical protein
MQMPEPSWYSYRLVDPHLGNVKAYEHEVSVQLPRLRYLRDGHPQPVAGSPSVIVVGEEERHGTELAVRRVSYDQSPSRDMAAELLGELTEAWVFMTMEMSNAVDPRWDS